MEIKLHAFYTLILQGGGKLLTMASLLLGKEFLVSIRHTQGWSGCGSKVAWAGSGYGPGQTWHRRQQIS